MQIVLLSLILWAGITYGGVILPYATNLIPTGKCNINFSS